ncbi:dihydrolipoamide succinyltransferase [Rhizophagus irregularis]|uniref:dihydrolipoyllysine-residue succinyltransferase n=1 Tax=Rhizophagus irregularis TaxID=588596 RepID=A0A2I1GAJ4_9GLOM|nr:dihydrolipoamide succinyltransferase [Rhizophagus irregularis]
MSTGLILMIQKSQASKVVKVPALAESITEGTLSRWNKSNIISGEFFLRYEVGDFVQQDEEVATIETDKVDAPVNSPYTGTIVELYAKEDDTVSVDQDLFKIETGGTPAEETETTKEEAKEEPKVEKEEPKKEELKEEKEEPKKEESKERKKELKEQEKIPSPSPPKTDSKSATTLYNDREDRHVKMNRMRLRIAERLKESQNTAASLTTFNEIDMSNIIDLRNTYKDSIMQKHGVKLGFMSAFVKASVFALQEIPIVNASIEGPDGGDTIVYRDYVDMSVAVATPKGLVTPVVRNAHLLSFIEIEKAIAELGKKARDGKITIEDMAGGTFTISNGGVYGSLYGTPIINMPQSAILGMHATKERPVAVNGKVEIRPMMYVALTYDHRLIDGREAVIFLKTIKEQIEDPRRLLLSI